MDLKGKGAFVTGASRGIGQAIARALASEGARLFITSRNSDALEKTKVELETRGAIVDFCASDLSDAAQVESVFEKAMSFLKGIDILINNAGFNVRAAVKDLAPSAWDTILSVNLRAPFLLSRLAARIMMAQGSGHIINIGSGASQTPIAESAAYCASKYGLLGFSESLALELRNHGIKVSIILPGTTATFFGGSNPEDKIRNMPGILRPEDVADSVLYLLRQSPQGWTSILNLRPLNPKSSSN